MVHQNDKLIPILQESVLLVRTCLQSQMMGFGQLGNGLESKLKCCGFIIHTCDDVDNTREIRQQTDGVLHFMQ